MQQYHCIHDGTHYYSTTVVDMNSMRRCLRLVGGVVILGLVLLVPSVSGRAAPSRDNRHLYNEDGEPIFTETVTTVRYDKSRYPVNDNPRRLRDWKTAEFRKCVADGTNTGNEHDGGSSVNRGRDYRLRAVVGARLVFDFNSTSMLGAYPGLASFLRSDHIDRWNEAASLAVSGSKPSSGSSGVQGLFFGKKHIDHHPPVIELLTSSRKSIGLADAIPIDATWYDYEHTFASEKPGDPSEAFRPPVPVSSRGVEYREVIDMDEADPLAKQKIVELEFDGSEEGEVSQWDLFPFYVPSTWTQAHLVGFLHRTLPLPPKGHPIYTD